ncbi:MAG: hypothetical protein GY855_04530, partial [candidate division Zixibacteria bacterium]|nr:hypothetical protein [candidate division Zixibacteria bacterium]
VPLSAGCEEWTGNAGFLVGTKQLDDDDWEPIDKHDELGIMVDFSKKKWPVSIAIDVFRSSDEDNFLGISVEGSTSELCLGIRKTWGTDNSIRPFLGAGLAIISAEFELEWLDDDDSAVGIWLGGGVYWTLNKECNLGLVVRYSDAEVTLFNVDGEAGGTHLGLIWGLHW